MEVTDVRVLAKTRNAAEPRDPGASRSNSQHQSSGHKVVQSAVLTPNYRVEARPKSKRALCKDMYVTVSFGK